MKKFTHKIRGIVRNKVYLEQFTHISLVNSTKNYAQKFFITLGFPKFIKYSRKIRGIIFHRIGISFNFELHSDPNIFFEGKYYSTVDSIIASHPAAPGSILGIVDIFFIE